ncbi:MAG: right-handed parallel beta-helix repeat-containing protein [Chitinophagaceae bacterium]
MLSYFILLHFLPVASYANSWYASENGLSTNAGTFSNPWPLSYALNRPSTVIIPGDTLWIRGGTYKGVFTSNLYGSSISPVTVRNYPNERAVIMGNATAIVDEVVLTINGQFSQFIGLEITSNAPSRISAGITDPPADIYTATGVYVYGVSVKLINCIIHDCPRGGIGYWKNSLNAEVYGCVVYNNGYSNSLRGHGPNIYIQNNDETKPKSIVNSFVFNGFSVGLQFYSSSSDVLRGFMVDSCTVFNSGANAIPSQARRMNLLAGGANSSVSARVRNLTVTNSIFYRDTTDNSLSAFIPYSSFRKNVELGTEDEALWDVDVKFNNNLIYGDPTPLLLHRWDSGSFRNNFLYAYKSNTTLGQYLIEQPNNAAPFSNWNSNTYYTNLSTFTTPFGDKTFANWKEVYGVDSNSTFTNTAPVNNQYFVRQNRFEPHKYYVTVQNYTGQNSVNIPVADTGLTNTAYAVFDVQNSVRIAVDTGTFNGSFITVNMNLTAVAALTGTIPVAPKHSSKTLGTFIIEFYPEFKTKKAGNWADPSVWDIGQVPKYFNKVRINHAVSITANAACKSVVVGNNAQASLQAGVLLNVGQQ